MIDNIGCRETQMLDLNFFYTMGRQRAFDRIQIQFENNQDPLNNLTYHNSLHTETVIKNTELILRMIRSVNPELVSEKDITLGKLAAAFHDVVQEWESGTDTSGAIKRMRKNGDNEEKSADESIVFIDNTVNTLFGPIFSEKDKNVVKEAIIVTIPRFNEGCVSQPNLTSKTSIVARAVALADLGTAGLESGERFFRDAVALFREDNINFLNSSNETKEQKKARMIEWLEFQQKFIEGRRTMLDQDLDGLDGNAINVVKGLFCHFDDSARMVRQNLIKAKETDTTFEELSKIFGY